MIRAKVQADGRLKITADNVSRTDLRNCYASGGYFKAEEMVQEDIWRWNFQFTLPENIGALTDAPIICDDLSIDDAGTVISVGDVWWFPNYQITDPWQDLKDRGRVFFDAEENNKSLSKQASR